ncbi:MAG: response regulator [Pseudomonadales bacterium]|nr:response regulator [Pseudomonadales bacterium]
MITPLLILFEDDKTSLDLIEDTAVNTGFDVKCFSQLTGLQHALNQETNPAILIIDIVMPDIDGLELIQWLADRKLKTPVIFTSGCDEEYLEDTIQLAARSGLDVRAVYKKPIMLHDLEISLTSIYHRLISN